MSFRKFLGFQLLCLLLAKLIIDNESKILFGLYLLIQLYIFTYSIFKIKKDIKSLKLKQNTYQIFDICYKDFAAAEKKWKHLNTEQVCAVLLQEKGAPINGKIFLRLKPNYVMKSFQQDQYKHRFIFWQKEKNDN